MKCQNRQIYRDKNAREKNNGCLQLGGLRENVKAANGYDFFWSAEHVLILIMVTAAQFCDYTKKKNQNNIEVYT